MSDNLTSPLTLSVVVACFDMASQVRNTLISLSTPYQRNILADEYEIILVDNGSATPLPREALQVAPNIRYEYIPPDKANTSPGSAINEAVRQARGEIICIMIDGARLLTPGALSLGIRLMRLSPTAVAEVRGWHLGPKVQNFSILEGYNAAVEQHLLSSIDWPSNGYRLFEIGVPALAAPGGFFGTALESCCVFLRRELYLKMGGFDERYASPGGGFANIDFFHRLVTTAGATFVALGEGTFHQIHGGAATGQTPVGLQKTLQQWRAEYEAFSRPFSGAPPDYEPILAGHVPKECCRWLSR